MPTGKGPPIEDGCGGGVNQEALVGLIDLKDYNREAIAALERDLGSTGASLRSSAPGS
jgi:hypothetical protein